MAAVNMAPTGPDLESYNSTEEVDFELVSNANSGASNTMTMYFIATALIMGLLLFFAIRKSVKIGLVEYFYDVPKAQAPGASVVWDIANINAGRLQEKHGKRMTERAGVTDVHKQIVEDKKPRKLFLINRRKGGIYFKNKSTFLRSNTRIVDRLGFKPAVYLISGTGPNQRIEPPVAKFTPQTATAVEDTVAIEVDQPGEIVNFNEPVTLSESIKMHDAIKSDESIFLSFARASMYADSGLGESLHPSARSSAQTLTSIHAAARKRESGVRSLRELMHGPMELKQKLPKDDDSLPRKIPAISVLHDSPLPTPPPSPGLPPPPPPPTAMHIPRYIKNTKEAVVSPSGIFMEADKTPRSSVHRSIQRLHDDDDDDDDNESVRTGSVVQFSNEVSKIEYNEESLPRVAKIEPYPRYIPSDDEDEDDEEEEAGNAADEIETEAMVDTPHSPFFRDDEELIERYNPQDDEDILGQSGNLPAVSEVLESDVVFREMSVDEEGEQVVFITRL